MVQSFEEYKIEKFRKAEGRKYREKDALQPEYHYLTLRMEAICGAIEHFLGKKELAGIVELYEREMTGRILSAREHA